MATASPSHLICPICEESYNERDHLPKSFPCQHSVCIKCLEGMIRRCYGNEVTCPLCRQAVPIPKSKAAGFPNNLLMLDLLAGTHSQSKLEVASSTCIQHNKVFSVFCLSCQEAMCMTGAFKSPEHKGHNMEELSDAMEKCIHRSEEVLIDIIQTASTLQGERQAKGQGKQSTMSATPGLTAEIQTIWQDCSHRWCRRQSQHPHEAIHANQNIY